MIDKNSNTTILIVVLVAAAVLMAAAVDWDTNNLPEFPELSEIFGPPPPPSKNEPDLAGLRKTIAENKNQLSGQRETQKTLAKEAEQNETAMTLLKESICQRLVEAEEKGTLGISIGGGRSLSMTEGREQLVKVIKTLRLLADEKQFRTDVVGKIDERIDEVSADLVRIDQAISIQDVADLFDKINTNKGRYEPIIDKTRLRVFDSIRNQGPLTEDELITLVSRPQTSGRYEVDVDDVLNEHRKSQFQQHGANEKGSRETLILVRPSQNGSKNTGQSK